MVDLTRYTPTPTAAGRVFALTDLSRGHPFPSADALLEWVRNGAKTSPVDGAEMPAPRGVPLLYRGQADTNYAFTSSLYRLVRAQLPRPARPSELAEAMRRAEAVILAAARAEGLGRELLDIELLALLQHHGVPTRMIDVSYGSVEALYFAVDQSDSRPGRFFVVSLNNPYPDSGLTAWHRREVPWGPVDSERRVRDRWNNSVVCYPVPPATHEAPPWAFDARMRAQKGTFLFGGLNDSPPAHDLPRQIARSDYADVRSASITFVGHPNDPPTRPATAWSVEVPAAWKAHIRRALREADGLYEDSVYPAVDEMRRLAMHVAREELRR